jgi:hypothetical protein
MKNITVTIPDEAYRNARVWAAQRDTSISAVVQYLLITLPGIEHAARGFPVPGSKSAHAKLVPPASQTSTSAQTSTSMCTAKQALPEVQTSPYRGTNAPSE